MYGLKHGDCDDCDEWTHFIEIRPLVCISCYRSDFMVEPLPTPLFLTKEQMTEVLYAVDTKMTLVRGWQENEVGPDSCNDRSYTMFEDEDHPFHTENGTDFDEWFDCLDGIAGMIRTQNPDIK